MADERAKDDFATPARLMCIAHAASVCVTTLEARAKFAMPGEKLDLTEAPSDVFDPRVFGSYSRRCFALRMGPTSLPRGLTWV